MQVYEFIVTFQFPILSKHDLHTLPTYSNFADKNNHL